MNSSYIQQVQIENNPDKKHKVQFTNLSSQQQYPGHLYKWHSEQSRSAQPMPFTHDDIPAPLNRQFQSTLSEHRNNVSQMSREDTREIFFRDNVKSNHIEFRTPSQRVWNVPFSQTEVRATDMF